MSDFFNPQLAVAIEEKSKHGFTIPYRYSGGNK